MIKIIGVVIITCVIGKIYLNFLIKEKNDIEKISELKNFYLNFGKVFSIKLDDILDDSIVNTKIFSELQILVNKFRREINKDAIIDFEKAWEEFTISIFDISSLNLNIQHQLKSEILYLGKIINTNQEDEIKSTIIRISTIFDSLISEKQRNFIKKKELNFKYMIISIILVFVLNM